MEGEDIRRTPQILPLVADRDEQSSGSGEYHPQALTDPDVSDWVAMSALGHNQTFPMRSGMSALHPKADIDPPAQNVR